MADDKPSDPKPPESAKPPDRPPPKPPPGPAPAPAASKIGILDLGQFSSWRVEMLHEICPGCQRPGELVEGDPNGRRRVCNQCHASWAAGSKCLVTIRPD